MNARRGRTVWRAVQLCRSRGAGAARSSVARHSGDCERSAGGAGARVRGVVFADGAAFDPAGKAAAGNAAANLLFNPLGASFDGPTGVRPSVPLVCRDRRRRRGVGPFGVLEEPRSAAGRRHRGEVPVGGAGTAHGDAEDFINELRSMKVTPHVAQNTNGRSSAIDERTTQHGGYAVSQRIRKRIEEAFGWIKVVAGQEKTKFRGRDRVGWSLANTARERLTLIRLFEELRALGYEGGYDAVRRYARSWVREHASQTADAYVPLTFAPGEAYATPTSFAGANATALRYDAGSILDVDLDWAPWGGQ